MRLHGARCSGAPFAQLPVWSEEPALQSEPDIGLPINPAPPLQPITLSGEPPDACSRKAAAGRGAARTASMRARWPLATAFAMST
eukprot:6303045-Alexandrium_andersonii.AAC.1